MSGFGPESCETTAVQRGLCVSPSVDVSLFSHLLPSPELLWVLALAPCPALCLFGNADFFFFKEQVSGALALFLFCPVLLWTRSTPVTAEEGVDGGCPTCDGDSDLVMNK